MLVTEIFKYLQSGLIFNEGGVHVVVLYVILEWKRDEPTDEPTDGADLSSPSYNWTGTIIQ